MRQQINLSFLSAFKAHLITFPSNFHRGQASTSYDLDQKVGIDLAQCAVWWPIQPTRNKPWNQWALYIYLCCQKTTCL